MLEHYLTDTARFADVVLPATMQLEHLDVHWSWGHHYLTLNEPAIEPVGECLPNSEIFRRLAARLGLDDPAFRETDEEMLAAVLAAAPESIDPADLRARGFTKIDLGQGAAAARRGRLSRHRRASSSCWPPRSATRASTRCRTTTRRPRWPTMRWPRGCRWRC